MLAESAAFPGVVGFRAFSVVMPGADRRASFKRPSQAPPGLVGASAAADAPKEECRPMPC